MTKIFEKSRLRRQAARQRLRPPGSTTTTLATKTMSPTRVVRFQATRITLHTAITTIVTANGASGNH